MHRTRRQETEDIQDFLEGIMNIQKVNATGWVLRLTQPHGMHGPWTDNCSYPGALPCERREKPEAIDLEPMYGRSVGNEGDKASQTMADPRRWS